MTTRRSRETQATENDTAVPHAHALQTLLGYTFKEPAALQLALTHRSYAYESRGDAGPVAPAADTRHQRNPPGTDNEQLEFLGDAILGMCVTEALYREFPQCTEGELTRMRAALVSRTRMAQMGAALELDKHLLLGKSAEQNAGRKKPALLANAAEAVIAAMYLDAGAKGLAVVCKLMERHLLAPERAAMRAALDGDTGHGALRDHKTLLQERVQAAGLGRLRYIDIAEIGPPHQRRFSVEARLEAADESRLLATAEGSSKKEAQQKAAELALASWEPSAGKPAALQPSPEEMPAKPAKRPKAQA